MLEKVRETIRKYNMLSEGEAVLCCLSGGADSVTLLLCLYELEYKVSAVHVNHCLRGEESDSDERFCRELCLSLGVPLVVKRVDVNACRAQIGGSTEEAARALRYKAFESCGFDKIATAHTLSDSFETALFNIARGTGAKGLCGIPAVRDKYIRPLISCTREEVEAFLTARGQSWVTDSTNLSDDYSRNRIRHTVIPVLKSLNSDAEHAFERLSNSVAEDDALLYKYARELLENARCREGYRCDVLSTAPYPVLSRAVILLFKENGLRYDSEHISEVCGLIASGGKICLQGSIYAVASQGVFRITALEDDASFCKTVEGDCEFEVFGKVVKAEITEKAQIDNKINKLFTYIALDYDKIKGVISVRNRLAGDRIRLSGRGCTKSIKKLFSESVPAERRDKVLLLCDDEGVAAVEGFGAAERCQVSDGTERVLLFGIKKLSCH